MGYREHPTNDALARWVDCVWTADRGPGTHRVLPDGCVDILIDPDAGTARVVGAMTRAVVVESGPRRLVAVRFRPGGAAAFLGGAVGALTDTGAELGDLWRDAEAFAEAVAAAHDPVSAVQRALVGRERRAVDRRLERAIDGLWAGRRVAKVAREVGWTRQHLTRRLTPVVGYGPALLARVGRLSRIVADARRGAPCWTELAHTHGFSDSAHLTHDFEDLVGLVPSAWRP